MYITYYERRKSIFAPKVPFSVAISHLFVINIATSPKFKFKDEYIVTFKYIRLISATPIDCNAANFGLWGLLIVS